MKTRCTITLTLAVLSLTACVQQPVVYEPIVDFKKVNRNVYAVDLKECQQYAEQVQNDAAAAGIVMALVGAAAGAAIGDSYGMAGQGAAYGATTGAVAGTAHGQSSYNHGIKEVVDNCLKGRGYKVLGKR